MLSRQEVIALAISGAFITAYLAYVALTGGSIQTHGCC
jgi:hypothetical protein